MNTPNLIPTGGFLLRTPLRPAAYLGQICDADVRDTSCWEEAVIHEARSNEIFEAISLASEHLAQALTRGESTPRVVRSAWRYISRLALRPTPFGAFAAVSAGTIGVSSHLDLPAQHQDVRHSQPDYGWLYSELVPRGTAASVMAHDVKWRVNSTLLRMGRSAWLLKRETEDGAWHFRSLQLAWSNNLVVALQALSEAGTLSAVDAALREAGLPAPDAHTYIDWLLANQVVEPMYGPCVTGPPTTEFAAQSQGLLPAGSAAPGTNGATRGQGATVPHVASAPGRAMSRTNTTLVRPSASLTLTRDVFNEGIRAATLLRAVGGARYYADVAEFARKFYEVFGNERVPLHIVLHPERGILRTVSDGARSSPERGWTLEDHQPVGATSMGLPTWLLEGVLQTIADGRRECIIEWTDLERAAREADNWVPQPPVGALSIALYGTSARSVDAGEYWIEFLGLAGPSGVELIARFANACPQLESLCRAQLAHEELSAPDAIHAEIVHMPANPREANVLARPRLREYELEYGGWASAPPERRLALSDLLVSVENEEIRLTSAKCGRRVYPHNSTAHNFSGPGADVYRFLCMLQYGSGNWSAGWEWGVLRDLPRLPRVRVGRCILARASWRLDLRDADELELALSGRGAGSPQALFDRRGLPSVFSCSIGDEELVADARNPVSVASVLHELRRRRMLRALEIPGLELGWPTCRDGASFGNQFVIPFHKGA